MARSASEIQLDLDAAYAARRAALTAEEYSVDSGQGKQGVKRNLANIENTIKILRAEMGDAETEASGGDFLPISFRRR